MSREIPIIFNGDMVRAILAGQKTQTRRPVRSKRCDFDVIAERDDGTLWPWREDLERGEDYWYPCPFGQPGDLLWVRETFSEAGGNAPELTLYRANYPGHVISDPRGYESIPPASAIKWRPPIHMPRWASRILLRNTASRVERLRDITEADAVAEGFSSKAEFIDAVMSIYGLPDDANPWVWVIEFEVVEVKL